MTILINYCLQKHQNHKIFNNKYSNIYVISLSINKRIHCPHRSIESIDALVLSFSTSLRAASKSVEILVRAGRGGENLYSRKWKGEAGGQLRAWSAQSSRPARFKQ